MIKAVAGWCAILLFILAILNIVLANDTALKDREQMLVIMGAVNSAVLVVIALMCAIVTAYAK